MLRPDFQNTDIELGRSGSASLVNNYALVWAPRLRMCRGFSTRDCREGHLVRAVYVNAVEGLNTKCVGMGCKISG